MSEPIIRNALTVDVEDYFQVAAFSGAIDRADWDSLKTRVESNTARLLEIFDRAEVKATFFILGWIAERYPLLVKEIHRRGHEVACHGYSHKLIYEQKRTEFEQETIRSKSLLENITGSDVVGYRAASYSITRKSLWAIDVIAEAGFKYDSSIFPTHHDRYGIPTAPRFPFRLSSKNGFEILEFPPSTAKLFGVRVPIGGGGYFRLMPYALTRFGLKRINKKEARPFIFYLHPWEIDTGQPRINAGFRSRFRHYTNIDRCEGRLLRLLTDFRFATVEDILAETELGGAAKDFSSFLG